ncbi:small ribosomal subunit protein mS29 [Microcaecilia unicolor]|uniref:Small ribosomal subunit protein mS29 n=1 Tax=Microcaecilia unicolor TaxID=1415580 RepID=A0A6P7WG59_9AMPH|nr:28S ribosomal protein S29, mitochondrial [Microcaecilia unicolor]
MMARTLRRLIPLCQKVDQGYLFPLGRAWITVAAAQDENVTRMPRAVFRTSESDPAKHGDEHEGQYYVLPAHEVKSFFSHGLPVHLQLQAKSFNETCLMVRRPALEVISYLRNTNFSHPAVRYVIYGQRGTGKSLTLCHVVHYCARQDWLLVHVPDVHILVKNCKELVPSSHNKGRYDQPLEASAWLKCFKITNERFLKQILTQQRYVWSKREATEEGKPLGEVIDQGLNRIKSASDALGVVLKELKRQCRPGAFRMLVAADGINSLWGKTALKREDKSQIVSEELTLVHNLRKMMLNDWNGGAIVTTVTQTGSLFQPNSAYLPHELLGKEGFDTLDPFVPIQVSNYSEKEFESCYQYYLERRWLQHEKACTEEGRKELVFLSNFNPRQLERICAFL